MLARINYPQKHPLPHGDILTNWRWQNFKELGSWPLLYNGGQRTYHRAISGEDLAEAMIRIVRHPDSPGHTFELYNDARHQLSDIVETLYEAQQEETFLFGGIRTTFDKNTKERTLTPTNGWEKTKQKMLRAKFGYYTAPRPIPRFVDMMNRTDFTTNSSFGWINEDYYNMINQSCKIENTENPGLKDLGIQPSLIEDMAMTMMARWNPQTYKVNNKYALKSTPIPIIPEGSENAVQMPKDPVDHRTLEERRTYDLKKGLNYEWQNALRNEWDKVANGNWAENSTIEMRPNHFTGKQGRKMISKTAPREMKPYALF